MGKLTRAVAAQWNGEHRFAQVAADIGGKSEGEP